MTGSTHEYEATLLVGDDQYPLGIRRAGRIVLDAGRAPHVLADLDLSLPDEATQLLLDPRTNARVRIDVAATSPTGVQERTFDLSLRSRPITHGPDAYARVTLASDEALLDTFRAGADDPTPFTLAASLRTVIDYVLGEAIPGAELEADPDNDTDLTPYWEVTNLIRNPAVVTDLANWSPGGGVTLAYVSAGSSGEVGVTMTNPTGAVFAVDTSKYNIPARPGERYTFSLAQRYVGSLTGSGRAVLRFLDNNNATISEVEGDAVNMTTSYERVEVTAVAPPSAVKVAPFWRVSGGTGRTYRLDQALLHTSPFPVPPFTGGDAAGGGYTYRFEGPSNDSASIRTPDVERDPDALVWRAGDSALDFLHPLVQAAGYRLVCDEQRRWTLRDENYTTPGSLDVREGVNLIGGEDVIDIDAGEWCDAQATVYRWTDRDGIQREAVDYYELNSPPFLVNRVEVDAPYPGPGRSQYAVRRAQGRGREVTVTTVADWRTHAEQPAQFTLDSALIQLGQTSRVEFDLSTDRMTVSSRTTDTPLGAIDLLGGTIDSLVGTIDAL